MTSDPKNWEWNILLAQTRGRASPHQPEAAGPMPKDVAKNSKMPFFRWHAHDLFRGTFSLKPEIEKNKTRVRERVLKIYLF